MTNTDIIKCINQVKLYSSAEYEKRLEYVIKVFQKFEKEGITDPLNADFSKISSKLSTKN